MSLGRELSLHARTARRPDDGTVPRVWRKHQTVAGPHRDAFATGEEEVNRAASAIEKLGVTVLVLAIGITRRVRPPIHVACLAAKKSSIAAGSGADRPP
jgi:hypothetical protein